VPENYLDSQQDINAKMRTILIDWLVEVHHRFDLMQETLYLTVHLVDRYLSIKQTSRNQLQLVGVTAMLVASKYEDMYPPEVADFVYISDNAFAATDILAMERVRRLNGLCWKAAHALTHPTSPSPSPPQQMLKTLDFALGKPLPLHFLRRNSRAGHADVTMHTVAKYLTELTLCSPKMLKYYPSEIAAAACYVSREVVNEPEPWNATIQHYADYSLADIKPCIEDMKEMLAKSVTCKQQATRNKYSDPKYLRIAKLPELETYIASL
jgi:cyclin B